MNTNKIELIERLKKYVEDSIQNFGSIDSERKELLAKVAEYIRAQVGSGDPVNLTFICTHNSRRSHISQLWAQAASYYYNVSNVTCFSAGTEATAFNPRAVRAMQHAGFDIDKEDDTSNPIYKVEISKRVDPIKAYSKIISDPFNEQESFAAIMTCSNADEACPIVHGANARFAVKYIDPKVSDDTPQEEDTYNERCRQISTEMFYLFSLV